MPAVFAALHRRAEQRDSTLASGTSLQNMDEEKVA
jgi:hypothetical protein